MGPNLVAKDDPLLNERYLQGKKRFVVFGILLLFVHTFCMLYHYGQRPLAPVIGDEVTINDAAIALSRGQGLIAPSFTDSVFGLDKLYAHFPPIYIYLQSLAFRAFGVSVYSLRLGTTVTDFCAMVAFLWGMYLLVRWRLADWRTAGIAGLLYTLDASVIALHRIARMEPLVELFCVLGLICVVAGTLCRRRPSGRESPSGQQTPNRRSFLFVLAGCVLAGLSMVTHPEALTAVLPTLLLVFFTSALSKGRKMVAFAVFAVSPAAVWCVTYGSRTVDALREIWALVRFTPGPGVVSFAHDFAREDHRNISQGMRATLFVLCVAVLTAGFLRWINLERSKSRDHEGGAIVEGRLHVARCFALAAGISVVLLLWFVGASVARYEVMFPVYLIGLVLALRGVSAQQGLSRAAAWISMTVIAGELIATGVYLFRPETAAVDADARRFDFIVRQIPQGSRIAATPMMWLAFQQNDRPFTLLYWRFDGRKKWQQENAADPFARFDAVVIDESFIDDYKDDSPYAAIGRTEQRFVVGSDVVHLYLPRR